MREKRDVATRGFTLLEIALAMAILSVVALYTLDMYQSMRSRKKQADSFSKAERINAVCRVYFSGHGGLPAAGDSFPDSVPVDTLGLGQEYRFDAHGSPFRYYIAAHASGFQVDGKAAAGVIVSLGENQLVNYTATGAGTIFTTVGDDVLVPIEVNQEAVAIALAELEILGKAVEGYQREYAGIQNDEGVSLYENIDAGAPPPMDPDEYDTNYDDWPQLFPYTPYYEDTDDFTPLEGPPPSQADLAYDEPDVNWPPKDSVPNIAINDIYLPDLVGGSLFYATWPSWPRVPPTDLNVPPPVENSDLPKGFAGWSGQGITPWPILYDEETDKILSDDVFGAYETPREGTPDSYELIDEGGCNPFVGDPNCVHAIMDDAISDESILDDVGGPLDPPSRPVYKIVAQYGFGKSLRTDPWGNVYLWGAGSDLDNTDPRYHLFYSAGPDTEAGTDDDVILY